MVKPTFNSDQLVPASTASKNFGSLRKRAKELPLFITDNGIVDTVILGYEQYEQMYIRLQELENIAAQQEQKMHGENQQIHGENQQKKSEALPQDQPEIKPEAQKIQLKTQIERLTDLEA